METLWSGADSDLYEGHERDKLYFFVHALTTAALADLGTLAQHHRRCRNTLSGDPITQLQWHALAQQHLARAYTHLCWYRGEADVTGPLVRPKVQFERRFSFLRTASSPLLPAYEEYMAERCTFNGSLDSIRELFYLAKGFAEHLATTLDAKCSANAVDQIHLDVLL